MLPCDFSIYVDVTHFYFGQSVHRKCNVANTTSSTFLTSTGDDTGYPLGLYGLTVWLLHVMKNDPPWKGFEYTSALKVSALITALPRLLWIDFKFTVNIEIFKNICTNAKVCIANSINKHYVINIHKILTFGVSI